MKYPVRRAVKADPFDSEIEAALQPGRHIGYSAVWPFVEALEGCAGKIVKLIPEAPGRAVILYETLLAGSYEKANELDDSGGDFGSFVRSLFCGWAKARQAAGANPEETIRHLLVRMDDDPYGFCYEIECDLVKLLDEQALAAFERCLRARFEGTAPLASEGRAPDPDYVRRRAAKGLRAVLSQQRRVDDYVTLCEASGLAPEDCLAVAKMLQARRKHADALAWVERGLALGATRPSSTAGYDLGRLRGDLLLKLGRGDAAREMAWREFEKHPNQYSYRDLMRYVPRAERGEWHVKAMNAADSADLLSQIELWSQVKELDRLVARLQRASDKELEGISHYVTEPVAVRLAGKHPELSAKLYRALGLRFLNAKKSKYYNAALLNFENARRCYLRAGLDAEWQRVVDRVRAEHCRKSGFIPGFENVVRGGAAAEPTFLGRAKRRWSASA